MGTVEASYRSSEACVTALGRSNQSWRERIDPSTRDSFGTRWDGGAVFASINGSAYAQILSAAFSTNGYDGTIQGHNALTGLSAFNGASTGYSNGDFITSVASLGNLKAGDKISLEFLGAWDEFDRGSAPNWQIDQVLVTGVSANVPEPASLALLGLGLAGLGAIRRKRS